MCKPRDGLRRHHIQNLDRIFSTLSDVSSGAKLATFLTFGKTLPFHLTPLTQREPTLVVSNPYIPRHLQSSRSSQTRSSLRHACVYLHVQAAGQHHVPRVPSIAREYQVNILSNRVYQNTKTGIVHDAAMPPVFSRPSEPLVFG